MGGILGEPLGQDQLSTHEFVAHLEKSRARSPLEIAPGMLESSHQGIGN